MTRVRDGDDAAFEAIYDRYAPGLVAFCHHMLSSRDDAEDALQHSLSAAYRMLRASDREVDLRPWLYTIARNRCLSVLRARRKDISLDATPERGGMADEVVDQVQRRSDLRDLVQDLRLLPDDQRAALVLFELGGLPHDEIATVLDVRREKVKALIFQAREGLMRARRARETPCSEMRRQLATLAGHIPTRSMLRRHVDRCPSCALFQAEVERQRAGLALILPVLPTAGLKAIILGSTVGRGTAVAGGASAGGGAAVLGSVGGGGGAACAGAGSGVAGLASAGAGSAGSGSILAGAAGGGISGAVATATEAGTVAAALGAHSATVVAKLLTVAVLVGGGSAATGDLARYAPDLGSVSAARQAAPAAAPSPGVLQLLAPAAPAPTVPSPVPAAGGAASTADREPLPVTTIAPPSKPATASQPTPGAGTTPAAPDGGLPATGGTGAGATPAPATNEPPAAASPGTAGAAPTATPTPATAVYGTTTVSAPVTDAPAAGQTTAGADPADATGGATPPAIADPADPRGGAGTPTTVDTGAPGTSDPVASTPTPGPTTVGGPAPAPRAEAPNAAP
ncbi:MAG TPA: sigma-70 family RNA polymerase sigma factor [Baekduia sp.]|nr:sigma-70 family RNA polymerase sigma factor [Baekduia sp.]